MTPDNLKSGVKHPSLYEPDLNPTYQALAEHYGFAVIPTRVRHPRDKAKVEVAVQVVERWVLARLRHQTFFFLAQLNQTIHQLLDELNRRPMPHLHQSRQELFGTVDRPALCRYRRSPTSSRTSRRAGSTSITMSNSANTFTRSPTP